MEYGPKPKLQVFFKVFEFQYGKTVTYIIVLTVLTMCLGYTSSSGVKAGLWAHSFDYCTQCYYVDGVKNSIRIVRFLVSYCALRIISNSKSWQPVLESLTAVVYDRPKITVQLSIHVFTGCFSWFFVTLIWFKWLDSRKVELSHFKSSSIKFNQV